MNVTQVTNGIKKIELFKDLVLNAPESESQFGVIHVAPRHFKDSGKNEYKLDGAYNLFVAHMYKGEPKEKQFFYITLNRRAERRDFRRHSFYLTDWNKVFASGKTVALVLADLKKKLIGYEFI